MNAATRNTSDTFFRGRRRISHQGAPRQRGLRGAQCATALLLLATASAAAGGGQRGVIKLWPEAVVIEDVILLGDIAQVAGFEPTTAESLHELVVATAPTPGGSRPVALSNVRKALSRSGINRARIIVKGAAECAVRRPTSVANARPIGSSAKNLENASPRRTGESTLRSTVTEYFDNQLSVYGGSADISFGRTAEQVLDLSGPEFTFRIHQPPGPVLGLIQLRVVVLRGTSEVQRIPMVVSVALLREVVTTRRPLNRGGTVQPQDVQLMPQRFTRTDRLGITDPAEVIGLRARRFVRPGELLDSRDLERVPLVRRGQIVEVYSRFGAVTVKTAAKVSEDGDFGALVSLHASGRRKTGIIGRVVGPRRVEVGEAVLEGSKDVLVAEGGR
ncbi:MAG: flagellar basal body P-ring formation protein FlgA [bacterium]|nr:flagellar basal body P-ring formation protein FlgA [bacterium]